MCQVVLSCKTGRFLFIYFFSRQTLNISVGFSKAAAGLTSLKTIMDYSLISLSQDNYAALHWHTKYTEVDLVLSTVIK